MTPQRWKRLSSRDVLRDRWVRLRADRCEIAPGRILDPFYVLEEHEWVHAIAFNRADEALLVRQYRYPVDAFTWELPGGWVNTGEDPLAAAQRELLEETGATAAHWQHLASPFANPARQTNRVHGYVARETVIVHPPQPDASEAVECAFFSVAQVLALIRDGSFSQTNHIALFYLALERVGRLTHQP
jgi:8-oxo-dGTP pyrophosphatase MutT (NUDIX family)